MEEKSQEPIKLADRIGPKTLAGILITLITAAAIGAVALRDLVTVATVDVSYLKGRSDDHESRLRQQEQRPPRLNPALDEIRDKCEELSATLANCRERAAVIERDIGHIEKEQEPSRLCARVQACKGNSR